MRFRDFFPKKDPSEKIEHRLFEIALFITVVFFLFWSVYSLFVDYTLTIKLIYWGGFLFYLIFYVAFKIKKFFFREITPAYYISLLLLVTASWFPAGGLDGPVLYWFLLIYISGLLVLHIKIFRVFLPVSVLIVVFLAYMELSNPELAAPYSSTQLRIQDLAVAGVVTLIILGIAILVFKRAYISDREKLKIAITELENEKIKAESADKAKTQFLATISHEMRTPLNGVVGITELLQHTQLSEEQTEMVENLMYSSRQLHNLISDVLDLTLIEDNKLIIEKREIRIRQEMENVIAVLKPALIKRNNEVKIKVFHDPKVPELLYGDEIRFRQILLNLVNNALKFTAKGQITVLSKLITNEVDFVTIHFSVSDPGEGIPFEKQDFLFNKFYKAKADPKQEGTGLGLSISKYLVELMKGTIGFTSTPGRGSEFYFQLPFEKRPDIKSVGVTEKVADMGSVKILLAEDTAINQMVAKKMLKNLGVVDLDIAENGQIAVDMCEMKDYDFVLMDLQMPEMDGITACRQILSQASNKPPIIIAVTANVMTTDLEECHAAGMKDFVSKPFQLETLRKVLVKFL